MARSIALIPFRSVADPKRRLAGVLSPTQRVALAQAMLADVIDVLNASATLPLIALLSRDVDRPTSSECLHLLDGGVGLNAAVRGAFARLRSEFGAHACVLVVPADLPLLPSAIVDRAFAALARTDGLVLAPALVDGGTNLLAQTAACRVAPRYGRDSYAAHCAAAFEAGLTVTTIEDPDAGRDIDRPDDLSALAVAPRSKRSACVARDWLAALPAMSAS